MALINPGADPTVVSMPSTNHKKLRDVKNISVEQSFILQRLLFLVFIIIFYCIELLWIKPVDGINDDWGMYSTLSGAYLGYPDAHVLFFLYPLSWLLCQLYKFCSFIPWYGLFQHGIHIACIYCIYKRAIALWRRHNITDAVWKPALLLLSGLFFLVDLNMISEAQYTTTAGFAAAHAPAEGREKLHLFPGQAQVVFVVGREKQGFCAVMVLLDKILINMISGHCMHSFSIPGREGPIPSISQNQI